jgi:hypothetical protein
VTLAEAKMNEFVQSLGDHYKITELKLVKAGNNFSTLIYPKK